MIVVLGVFFANFSALYSSSSGLYSCVITKTFKCQRYKYLFSLFFIFQLKDFPTITLGVKISKTLNSDMEK